MLIIISGEISCCRNRGSETQLQRIYPFCKVKMGRSSHYQSKLVIQLHPTLFRRVELSASRTAIGAVDSEGMRINLLACRSASSCVNS